MTSNSPHSMHADVVVVAAAIAHCETAAAAGGIAYSGTIVAEFGGDF